MHTHTHELPNFLFEEIKSALVSLSTMEMSDVESQYNRILVKRGILINEATFTDIETRTNSVVIGRGIPSPTNPNPYDQEIKNPERTPRIRLSRADPGRGIWVFTVPGCRSQGGEACPPNSKDRYTVTIKGLRRGTIKDLRRADIEISCTCPFFRWNGPEYNARVGNYQYKSPAGTASEPNIRDPGRINKVCKHVIAVFGVLKKFPFFID